jgi:hypothetical protein
MLQVFEQWRADNPDPPTDAPRATAAAAGDQPEPDPPCDLVGGAQSTTVRCQEAGAAWAKGELSDTILWRWWGLQILVAVLAAWSFGVALFGWWKPWWTPRADR